MSTGTQDASSTAYTAQFEQARQQATSDFERGVLSDDQITRAEYEEAVQLFVQCLAGKGITVTPYDQGGFYGIAAAEEDTEAFEREADGCAEGTTALIEPLYIQILQNPDQGDFNELVAACLIESGLADASFTAQQFEELLAQGQGAQWPFDIEDARFGACVTNPSNPEGL